MLARRIIDLFVTAALYIPPIRRNVYELAIKRKLRNTTFGHILLRNINRMMRRRGRLHDEFSRLINGGDFQSVFWSSDLGYVWHEKSAVNKYKNPYFEYALDLISQNEIASVLDVGCGRGFFCAQISKYNPKIDVLGIDISESVVKEACEINGREGAVFLCKRLDQVNGQYDLVTVIGVLDYIDPSQIELFIRGLVEHSNIFVIAINSLRGIDFDAAQQLDKSIQCRGYDVGYVHPLKNMFCHYPWKSFEIKRYGIDSQMVVARK